MGYRVVKQPNGRLAIFSSYVDDFVASDGTPTTIEISCVERLDIGRETACSMIRDGLEDRTFVSEESLKDDGLNNWRRCLEAIGRVHGNERVQNYVEQLSQQHEQSREVPRLVRLEAAERIYLIDAGWEQVPVDYDVVDSMWRSLILQYEPGQSVLPKSVALGMQRYADRHGIELKEAFIRSLAERR